MIIIFWYYEIHWIDDDEYISESRICVVKYQDEKLNIISQLIQEFDDWYDEEDSHDYFYTQKNLTDDKEIKIHEEIIPYYTHSDKMFELLQKLDQIETVEEVKELMKNEKWKNITPKKDCLYYWLTIFFIVYFWLVLKWNKK